MRGGGLACAARNLDYLVQGKFSVSKFANMKDIAPISVQFFLLGGVRGVPRDHWRAAHEREQAAHAATQRLLLPGPATAAERDAPATREGAPAPETPLKFWCW